MKDGGQWRINFQAKTQIHAFDGAKVRPIGTITLSVYVADWIQMVNFFIVDIPSIVTVIIGWEWVHAIKGVVSTLHQVLRCQSPDRLYTIDIKGDPIQNQKYFNINIKGKIKRLSEEQIKQIKKGKAKVDEGLPEGEAK